MIPGGKTVGDAAWKRAVERQLRHVASDALKHVEEQNTCAARLEGYLALIIWPDDPIGSDHFNANLERYFRVFHKQRRSDYRALSWSERANQLVADFQRASRARRGRPRDTDAAADAQVSAAFKKSGLTYAQYAATKGLKPLDVERAVDRHRKRPKQARSACKK
jgi:hypothetical protein